ncbi:MAG: hypothetical protein EP329_00655 [Deltaproteobacteria bacterium]|nr:MAG: hypothetical protein EP329_00655 [Deltaproteobacteria bacterium]
MSLAATWLLLAGGGAAHAELVWEPIGPVPGTAGMTAVVSDPVDPQILWIASNSSVWVSDDAGDTFSLVLQLSRATAIERNTGEGEQIEVDPVRPDDPGEAEVVTGEDGDQIDPDTGELYNSDDTDAIDANDDIDPLTGLPISPGTETVSGDEADDASDALDAAGASGDSNDRFGVTRLRVIEDKIYVCTGRGLWTVDRAARRPGTGREVRFGGRRVAVNDVLRDARGRTILATERGLLELGDDGLGRRVVGSNEDLPIFVMAQVGSRLVLVASDGLRIETPVGMVPLGLGRSREATTDLLQIDERRFLVASTDHVTLVVAEPDGLAFVDSRWQVPGILRLAPGRSGAVWAIGAAGAWEYDAETGWRRRDEGLIDRRLADVAPAQAGSSFLYVVGRGGTARLVPEQEKLWTKRAQFQARRALEGLPSAEETLGWASNARAIKVGDAKRWETESSLAWLLPHAYFRVISTEKRVEEYLFIPAVGRRILDAVEVQPVNDEIRVELRWDLMPALMLALEGTDPAIRAAEIAARRGQKRVRDTVGPLYQTWMKKRIDLVATEFTSTRDAVSELLAIEQLEADLHVYTAGKFPIIGVTRAAVDAPPSPGDPSP